MYKYTNAECTKCRYTQMQIYTNADIHKCRYTQM